VRAYAYLLTGGAAQALKVRQPPCCIPRLCGAVSGDARLQRWPTRPGWAGHAGYWRIRQAAYHGCMARKWERKV